MKEKIIVTAEYTCAETLEKCLNSIQTSLDYENDLNSIIANEIILNDQIWKMPKLPDEKFFFVLQNCTSIDNTSYKFALEQAKSLFSFKYKTNNAFAEKISEIYYENLKESDEIDRLNMPKPIYILYMNAEDPINPDNFFAYSKDPHILDEYALELKDADPDMYYGQYEIYKIDPIEKKFSKID